MIEEVRQLHVSFRFVSLLSDLDNVIMEEFNYGAFEDAKITSWAVASTPQGLCYKLHKL